MSTSSHKPAFTAEDAQFMRRALRLAARGRGRVEPNPMVGCVLVRSGKVVGEGYHRKFGTAHAEVNALAQAGKGARGATAYVTLEPCCHHGKTGPCTDGLLAAGVARVVAAMADPFAKVAGQGIGQLRKNSVQVDVGLLEPQARQLNAPYLKRLSTGMPWVLLKWAQSLDGKLATVTGHSQWITAEAARKEAHRLRGQVDAVVVGAGTVASDNPQLTCRLVKPCRTALRIVVDGRLSLPLDCHLVRTAGEQPTAIVCTTAAAKKHRTKAEQLRKAGCEIVALPQVATGRIDLPALLKWCGSRQMTNIMVEGGGGLLGAFLDGHLADEVAVFVAPMLIGGGATAAPGIVSATPWLGGTADLTTAPRIENATVRRLGPDIYLRGRMVVGTRSSEFGSRSSEVRKTYEPRP